MNTRVARWLAWALVVLYVACIAGTAVFVRLMAVPRAAFVSGFSLALAFGMFALVGALIASHRPGNAIGWLFCALGVCFGFTGLGPAYAQYGLEWRPGALPGAQVVGWLADCLFMIAFGLMTTFAPLLFPDGRLPSRRWRPAAWLAGAAIAAITLPIALTPGPFGGYPVDNPAGIPGAAPVLGAVGSAGNILLPLAVLLAVGSVFVRFRRSRGAERQQIKWVVYAIACGLVLFFLVDPFLLRGRGNDVDFAIVVGLPPLAVGVAVLRYRLYDIDLLINRTLVYGALTAMLAAVYFAGVAALQAIFRAATGQGSNAAIVASTLVIAALFQPLRRRLQGFIDRRFYRRKYDAAQTLAAFGATLRDETDLGRLQANLLATVDEALQPAHASLWLRPAAGAAPVGIGRERGEDGEWGSHGRR